VCTNLFQKFEEEESHEKVLLCKDLLVYTTAIILGKYLGIGDWSKRIMVEYELYKV
jgi:hypothetical protein